MIIIYLWASSLGKGRGLSETGGYRVQVTVSSVKVTSMQAPANK